MLYEIQVTIPVLHYGTYTIKTNLIVSTFRTTRNL